MTPPSPHPLPGLVIETNPAPTANPGTLIGPKSAWMKTLILRILFGCLCSIIVGTFTNLPYIKMVVLWLCQAVLVVFGKPDLPEPVMKKLEPIIAKGKDVVENTDAPHKPLSLNPAKVVAAKVEEKAEEATHKAGAFAKEKVVDPLAEMMRERKERQEAADKAELERLQPQAAELGLKGYEDWPLPQLRKAVRQAAADKAEKERLMATAAELRMSVEESWDLPRLRAEVHRVQVHNQEAKQKAYLEWWAKYGPNGKCPVCQTPMRVSLRGTGRVACHNARCQVNVSSSQVRAQGAPPPPKQYPPAFLLWWDKQ